MSWNIRRNRWRFGGTEKSLDGSEAAAVLGTGAQLLESLLMLECAVTDVLLETVAGILLGELDHVAVAGDFGDDGGGGDFFDEEVSFGQDGNVRTEWRVGEEVNGAVNHDFVEGELGVGR